MSIQGKQKHRIPQGKPKFMDDEAFKSLRVGDHEMFNAIASKQERIDLTGCDLRGTDFRHMHLDKVILSGCYLRDADLRGCDLRNHDLEGASLRNAKISGVYFPETLSAQEIRLSHEFGTRLRMGH